jgi:hypothetical protein
MKKYRVILLLFLGFLFMPNNTMACGKISEKTSSTVQTSSHKTEKKSCCSNHNSKEKKGCEGDCENSKCSCSSTCSSSSVSFLTEIYLKSSAVNCAVIKKIKFHSSTPSVLDGFYSIWAIPKIS